MEPVILVADDSIGIVDILSSYLLKAGYKVLTAFDGEEALRRVKEDKPALVLLDIMMPKIDGLQVLREIRRTARTPVIMITARGEDADVVMGLDDGADDYIVKPFSPQTVLARVRAVLRRLELSEDDRRVIRYPDLAIDIDRYEVRVKNQAVQLSKKETEILWLLANNPQKVFSRDNLLDSIWGYDYEGDLRAVDTHIKRLRAKLSIGEDSSWDIKTVWGVGYKFEDKSGQ